MKSVFFCIGVLMFQLALGQQMHIRLMTGDEPLRFATIKALGKTFVADSLGSVNVEFRHGMVLEITAAGFESKIQKLQEYQPELVISLMPDNEMDQVVVSGTLKAVKKSDSPVPVEIYTPVFLKKNPSPDLFGSLQLVNGVRPQLNCSVCNTGDIHINGLEGAYTAVLIDGMPLMSSLATVYGLFAIPPSIVERIEIIKGPASSLYGTEAIGGLINIITKTPAAAPDVFAELSLSSWKELNGDLAVKYRLSNKLTALGSMNIFNYTSPKDYNHDNFTDVTLQKRIAAFNRLDYKRKDAGKLASVALRYIYENRWGGELNWNKSFRGGDDVYGEHIETSRMEVAGVYDIPGKENLSLAYSAVHHLQHSAYGTTIFNARQSNAFTRLTWNKTFSGMEMLSGLSSSLQWYDDNTPATHDPSRDISNPDNVWIPGIFTQVEVSVKNKHHWLGGLRYDYDPRHGSILTPRMAYKLNLNKHDILRLNMGTGFRVVNIFTEDHAALTGAREVVIHGNIRPEKSLNFNLNYVKKLTMNSGWMNWDASIWYTRFSNKIAPDYSVQDKIIYQNLNGFALSKGISLNTDWAKGNRWKGSVGITVMDVILHKKNDRGVLEKQREMLSEKWTGTWTISYTLPALNITIDYTGNIYGPMRLPLVSELDPRPEESTVWSIQNIQFTWKSKRSWEIYGGIKNLLDFTPAKHVPFLIARAHDPFDKLIELDSEGIPLATPENPYALSFDTSYIYAPNQGMRGYVGVRMSLYK